MRIIYGYALQFMNAPSMREHSSRSPRSVGGKSYVCKGIWEEEGVKGGKEAGHCTFRWPLRN